MDDGWDCFGEAPADAPPPKIARPPPSDASDAAAAAAMALFEGADVPEPPPAPDSATQGSGSVNIWPDAPPVYTGPVRLVEDDGVGGRGFVAERDVHPGELLLLEAPHLTWAEAHAHEPLPMLRQVLQSVQAVALLRAMAQLHPVALTPTLRQAWQATHAEAVALLLPGFRTLRGELGEPEACTELLRLCLTLQFNGFSSGLFLHQAIFNHGCAAEANCDKVGVYAPPTPRGLRTVRTGHAYQPPACCTYRRHRTACPGERTAARASASGVPCLYVPCLYVLRTVAPQAGVRGRKVSAVRATRAIRRGGLLKAPCWPCRSSFLGAPMRLAL